MTWEKQARTAELVAAVKAAGSAEEMFSLLDVAFDAKVLNVARLHILKRMGDHIAESDLERLPPEAAVAQLKDALARAYQEFVTSAPIEQRVFKVHQDAIAPPPTPAFVPIETLGSPAEE